MSDQESTGGIHTHYAQQGPVPRRIVPLWLSILLPALGGWLGWGWRGQFGHEAGAFVPGALIALGVALCSRHAQVRQRALLIGAVGAIAMGYGGTITYGQTNGLMYNEGWQQTYWWGFLGLAVKSSMWFGLGAVFMAMAAGYKKYSAWEILGLTAAMTVLFYAGYFLLNKPFDPEHGRLPAIYFSDFVNKGKPDWKPRQEFWGGLWFGLLGLMLYVSLIKKDPFATRVGLWGIVGGGIAMPVAQSIHAWVAHQAPVAAPVLSWSEHLPLRERWHMVALMLAKRPWINWWSVFETTCGFIAGLFIATGWVVSERGRTPLDEDEWPATAPAATTWAVGLIALTFLVGFLLYPSWRGPWSVSEEPRISIPLPFGLGGPGAALEINELMVPFITAGSWIAFAFTGQFGQWANLLGVLTATAALNITDNWAEKQWIVASWPRPAAYLLTAAFMLVAWLLSRKKRGGVRVAASALTWVGGIQIVMCMAKSWINDLSLSTWGFPPHRPPDPGQCMGVLGGVINVFAYICAYLVIVALAWWGACRAVAEQAE